MKKKKIISNLDESIEDSSSQDYINRKKDLILLDYQSLFDVYNREFTIVYSFRGWAVGLLTTYFGLLFTFRLPREYLTTSPALFIIIAFYILEVAERSVMRRLLKEVRHLESIFMSGSQEEFDLGIRNYIFRDLRDEKRSLKVRLRDLLKSTVNLQVIAWNFFLIAAYYFLSNVLAGISSIEPNSV